MKKLLYVLVLIIFCALFLKSCINRDVPENPVAVKTVKNDINEVKFVPLPKTVTINGVDYLQSQAPVGRYGGNFVSSTIGEGPKTFNPYTSQDATSSSMSDMMYDGLVTSEAKSGEVIPKLAKSFEISKDGKTYVFHLRRGIKWSDGSPITSDDVYFTWHDIIFAGLGNTATRDSLIIDGKLPKVIKVDKYTVKFVTSKPFAPFLRTLSVPIAPKHFFEPAVKMGEKYFDSFLGTTTPPKDFVVSGAFKVKEYLAAQRVVFEKNPNYYEINLKNQKLPYLNKVIYLIVGDLNNEILKFEARELDIISLQGSNVGRYKAKEAFEDYKIYNLGADTSTMFVTINLNRRKDEKGKPFVNPVKQRWFNDLNFRSAVDYALDRKDMINNVASGVAEPLFTAESLNSIYLNKKISKGHNQNIKIAKIFLKKSGFYLKKGVLYDKYGNRVEFDLYTNAGNTEREALGVMVKQDLENLGMKVNFKPIEFNTLVNKMVNTFDWDMVIMGLTGSPLEPHNGQNVWCSNGALHLFNQRKSPTNDVLPFEAKLDKIFNDASLKIKYEDRKKLYDEYQMVVYSQKPVIYLYSPLRMIAIRKKFANIFPSALSGVAYNLDEIYIKEGKN